MHYLQKNRKVLRISAFVILAAALAYWFFMYTNRGSSIALYSIGGWGAPLQIRWDCGKETDRLVVEKFKLPLDFTKESKDELRGFWYYSYYRQCLYRNHFDFDGNPIPASTLNNTQYINQFAGIQFVVPQGTTLTEDNALNVDIDDRLYVSNLETPSGRILIHTYLKNDNFSSFDDLSKNIRTLTPLREGSIKESVSNNEQQISFINFTQSNGHRGILLLTPEKHVIHISGLADSADSIDVISKSISFVP
jgi:hypothetical protein